MRHATRISHPDMPGFRRSKRPAFGWPSASAGIATWILSPAVKIDVVRPEADSMLAIARSQLATLADRTESSVPVTAEMAATIHGVPAVPNTDATITIQYCDVNSADG